jgi:RimJ/RimL family protein N-acetyltransferase
MSAELIDASAAQWPAPAVIAGRYARLEAFDIEAHGDGLWASVGGAEHVALWDYMPEGPFVDRADFDAVMSNAGDGRVAVAILDAATGLTMGRATYMNIVPKNRCLEVGAVMFSPQLQRTRIATEAMYLMMRYAFEDLAYRRYEWKCNALNVKSRRAAERLGFTFEGIFRQHMIVKGRSRDTAWFSIIDGEWPGVRRALEQWLLPENFDERGIQRRSLSEVRGALG